LDFTALLDARTVRILSAAKSMANLLTGIMFVKHSKLSGRFVELEEATSILSDHCDDLAGNAGFIFS
jgi:hypothetical protein